MADVATIDPDKTANSHGAIPEAARKAAGANASEPSQPPNAGAAINADDPEPDNSIKRPGAVSNSPTRTELEASYQVNTTPEHVNRLAEPQAGDPESAVVEDEPKRSSARKSSAKRTSAKKSTKSAAKKSAKRGK